MGEFRVRSASIAEYVINGEAVGLLVLSEKADDAGRDLLIVAMAGDHPEFFPASQRFVDDAVREGGYDGQRCYTARPGLIRRLLSIGWEGVKMGLRKDAS